MGLHRLNYHLASEVKIIYHITRGPLNKITFLGNEVNQDIADFSCKPPLGDVLNGKYP